MRLYDPKRDSEAVFRIHREVGWAESDDRAAFDILLSASRVLVEEVNGNVECMVLTVPGEVNYLSERLPFWGVNGVTTSRVARKLGLAQRLTAESVARAADDGAALVGLGMFEQGFYNQIGFGTGNYVHEVTFDPAELTVNRSFGVPVRLGKEDAADMHRARHQRMHWHGMVDLMPEGVTAAEVQFPKNGFGLGYRNAADELTHYFWANARSEHGPYNVWWVIYRTWDQFMELLALLKALGDQVHTMTIGEPAGIQMQDLLRKPFKTERVRRHSENETGISANAFWQVRICDLAACLGATHLPGPTVRFNLTLDDPITDKLTERTCGWRGVGGDYTVTLGPESSATTGATPGLPTLTTTVNAFSRMWLGVQPASGLAVTDDVYAPPELLRQLDGVLRLPAPNMDWYF